MSPGIIFGTAYLSAKFAFKKDEFKTIVLLEGFSTKGKRDFLIKFVPYKS